MWSASLVKVLVYPNGTFTWAQRFWLFQLFNIFEHATVPFKSLACIHVRVRFDSHAVNDETYPKCECTVSLGKNEDNQEYHIFTGLTLAQILTKITPLAEKYSETGWGSAGSSDDDVAYDDGSDDTSAGLSENLLRDIEEISSRFSERQRPEVSFNKVMGILYVTMKLNPKLYLPNRMFATAWGIQFDLPIHIELKFSAEVSA